MANKIMLLISLLSYSIVVSQPFMYMLALSYTQKNISAAGYTEMRKLIDTAMRNHFKYVLYTAVLATLALVVLNSGEPGGLMFATACIALIALVAEILLAVKGNVPINNIINTWPAGNPPAEWTIYRDKWLRILGYRGMATITGFVALLVSAIFDR